MATNSSTPRKIAVLGGGMGGLSAALELTATPELRARHEVTIYTDGWLLGGKCASARNPAEGFRSEENGLSLLPGFSEETIQLLRRCYADLERPVSEPLATFDSAFSPRDTLTCWERFEGSWHPWALRIPAGESVEGTSPEEQLLNQFVRLLREGVAQAAVTVGVRRIEAVSSRFKGLMERLGGNDGARAGIAKLATGLAGRFAGSGDTTQETLWLVDQTLKFMTGLESNASARRLTTLLDLGRAIVQGLQQDDVVRAGFSSLDGDDFSAWLTKHGSRNVTSAPVMALHSLLFAFPDGNWRRPTLAAGVALRLLQRMLSHPGAPFFVPNAGYGETVFAPVYEVLKKRGVRFRFFQKVCGLKLSTDGTRVERIRIGQQVRLKGLEYEPLVPCGPLKVWPAEPDYAQITAPADLRRHHPRAHTRWPYPHFIGETVLQRGVDFHEAVLAIPAPALGEIAQDFVKAAPDTWGAMIKRAGAFRRSACNAGYDSLRAKRVSPPGSHRPSIGRPMPPTNSPWSVRERSTMRTARAVVCGCTVFAQRGQPMPINSRRASASARSARPGWPPTPEAWGFRRIQRGSTGTHSLIRAIGRDPHGSMPNT